MRAGRIMKWNTTQDVLEMKNQTHYWDRNLPCGVVSAQYLPSIQRNSNDDGSRGGAEELAEGRRRGMQRRNRGLNFAVRVRGGQNMIPGSGIGPVNSGLQL